MNGPVRHVPQETLRRQALASDPALSAWVSAHAGSGKTHVLSRRVVRLLLAGTDPSRILCLTYTRAAAANMANRVFRDLARWATLDEKALAAEISDITGAPAGPEARSAARRLFARALETPGGLKIQTIHAFCEAVLHQFPLEANIAGHFEMLDPQMEAALLAEARRDLITGAAGGHEKALTAAFADVLERAGESGLTALLAETVRERDRLGAFIGRIAVDEPPFAALLAEFGFDPTETAENVAAACWPLPGLDPVFFARLAGEARATGAAQVINNILPHAEPAFAETDPVARLDGLVRGLLKSDGAPYGERTFRKSLLERLPGLPARYGEAAAALIETRDRLALFSTLAATRSALVLADWLIARYETLKRARGFLDFNDLITRTAALLSREEAGAWVHYKLDRGIDHILIDEAQDTSPDQWEVVKRLADEFFAGRGAREDAARTIFAVGDEKQSIYSFQGAEPRAFGESGRAFEKRVVQAQERFERVRLTQSFRSTGDVLSAVDLVFSLAEARRGLTLDEEPVNHDWIREGEPGHVEIWASMGPQTVEEPEDWTQAIDHASAPAVRLAEEIADTIAGWIARGEMLEGKGRPIRPGDVMVLVRKRDRFVHALSRALKDERRRIPVAGADRLLLSDHIAVKDLLALGRFCLQPHDDLSLAALLKSPVFGLGDDDLFAIAHDRGDVPLFEAMRLRAGDDPRIAQIVEALQDWRDRAGFQPVFEFYAGILAGEPGREGARGKLVARLGAETGDILDEFLSFALSAERAGGDGLEAFIATLDTAAPEIKREMDQTRDQLRIMTVHASKGLEAPVVFLVDPGSAPFSAQHRPQLMRFSPARKGWEGEGFIWRGGAAASPLSRELEEAIRQNAEAEYRRLLYVGMTRAEDRLVICGYHGRRGPRPDTWHAMAGAALAASPHARELPAEEGKPEKIVYQVTERNLTQPAQEDARPARQAVELPQSLLDPLPPRQPAPRPLVPSGAVLAIGEERGTSGFGRSPVLDPAGAAPFALSRGSALHRLLQVLPGIAPQERAAAAARYLARAGADWPEGERERTAGAALKVLCEPSFAPLFGPGSRAEVSVSGKVKIGGRERAVSGKIDRLALTGDAVLIVDYKSGRLPPDPGAAEAHAAQIALYRALVAPLYPHRRVRAALLFTGEPVLVELDAQSLDDALVRLESA